MNDSISADWAPLDAPARRSAADRSSVQTFEGDGDVHGRVLDAEGRWSVWLEGTRERDQRVRISTLLADRQQCRPEELNALLDEIESGTPARYAFRHVPIDGLADDHVDLLASTPETDALWTSIGRAGPADHANSAHQREHEALARYAEARISAVTGEDAPRLADRVEFLTPDEFERALPGSDHVLGAYDTVGGRLLVKDAGDLRSHGVLIHEGLHALRAERAMTSVPRELDEAITEYFTRVIDPAASGAVLERREVDGTAIYAVPRLETPVEVEGVTLVRRATPYEERLPLVEHLESVVGRDAVWRYYRTGDPSSIRRAYDGRAGPGAWTRLIDATEHGSWEVPQPWRRDEGRY